MAQERERTLDNVRPDESLMLDERLRAEELASSADDTTPNQAVSHHLLSDEWPPRPPKTRETASWVQHKVALWMMASAVLLSAAAALIWLSGEEDTSLAAAEVSVHDPAALLTLPLQASRTDMVLYTVGQGDALDSVAAQFDLQDMDRLIWPSKISKYSPLRTGVQPPSGPIQGVWLSADELAALPTSGPAWESVVQTAYAAEVSGANVSDQDSGHDTTTLAVALAAARLQNPELRAKALAMMEGAIGTEEGGRWLAVGRNLGSYIIAADLLGVRDGPIYDWLAAFNTRTLETSGQTLRMAAWESGSNASAQVGFVHTALAAYLGNQIELEWGWNAFRRYAGDRTSRHKIISNSDVWQEIPDDPIGIQQAGVTKHGCRLDGAISNDMSRGNDDICHPEYTQYPWVGLEGAVPAAMVFDRKGYPAFEIADQALKRAADYQWYLRELTNDELWYDDTRAAECKHLLNLVYGLSYPVRYPVGQGRTVGFTDWTHPG